MKIQIAAPISKNTLEHAKTLSKYGQVRSVTDTDLAQKVLGRLCVVDGEEFVLGLTDDAKTHPTQDVALWTQSAHATSNIFDPMFDLVWQSAKPVK